MRLRSVARWAACASLVIGAFEACTSSSNSSSPVTPAGPPSIFIATPLESLSCDDSLVVHLTFQNWNTLRPPYNCGSLPNCGSVKVSLLDADGVSVLFSVRAATADVQLDLTDLVSSKSSDGTTLSQVHFVKAELFGDSLLPFPVSPGSQTFDQQALSLSAPTDCASVSGAGEGGAAGAESAGTGASGAPASGGAGVGGNADSGGSGGSSTNAAGGAVEVGTGGELAAAGAAAL